MARNDYTPEQRAAWQAVRIAAERARGQGQHAAGVNRLPRYTEAMNPFGRNGSLAKLTATLDKQLADRTKEVDRMIAEKAPKHSRINSTVPSTCLADLSWKDGIATATFYRGGDLVYDYPMSLDEFLDWVESDSIGAYGNAVVFD